MLQSENAAHKLQFHTRRIYSTLSWIDYTDLTCLGYLQERANRRPDPRSRDPLEEAQESGEAA